MQKKHVFVVGGRYRGADGVPRGDLIQVVACGVDEVSARKFVEKTMPNLSIATLTSLLALEAQAKKVKAVLAGQDLSWSVLVEPALDAG